jgi:hypothetical protein
MQGITMYVTWYMLQAILHEGSNWIFKRIWASRTKEIGTVLLSPCHDNGHKRR